MVITDTKPNRGEENKEMLASQMYFFLLPKGGEHGKLCARKDYDAHMINGCKEILMIYCKVVKIKHKKRVFSLTFLK